MAYKVTLSESLIFVVRIALFTVIVTAAVLAVDVAVLWLLGLQTDVGVWITLLLLEGVIMAFLGAADLASGFGGRFESIWRRPSHHPKTRVRYMHPWFWLSVGIAGIVLFSLSGYLGLVYG